MDFDPQTIFAVLGGTAVVAKAAGSFFAKKTIETTWNHLTGFFQPDPLQKQIETALSSNESVVAVCKPPPTLVRDRLTKETIDGMLGVAVSGDLTALAKYLTEEQVVVLPIFPDVPVESYDIVWKCIADCIVVAIRDTVESDERLFRKFQIEAVNCGLSLDRDILANITDGRADVAGIRQLLEERLPAQKAHTPAVTDAVHGSISSPSSIRAINLLAEQNEQLEGLLREQLDAATRQCWDSLIAETQRHNFRAAIGKGKELLDWLGANGPRLSPEVRGRAYLIVANAALVDTTDWGTGEGVLGSARELFDRARTEFGSQISGENSSRMRAFDAKLLFVEGRIAAAIQAIGVATDPQSISSLLAIYIDSDQPEVGARLAASLPIDDKWCDHAAYLHAHVGDHISAEAALSWAAMHGDVLVERRCRVAYARGTLARLGIARQKSALSVLSVSDEERSELGAAESQLAPIVDACLALGKVTDGLEADAIALAYIISRLLDRRTASRLQTSLLAEFRPIHFEFVRAVFRGHATAGPDLAKRLRADYPTGFAAHDLALGVEIREGLPDDAILERVATMQSIAKTAEDKEKLALTAFQVICNGSQETREAAEALITSIVGHDHRLCHVVAVDRALKAGDFVSAQQLIDELDDDGDYLVTQMRAQLHLGQGRTAEAAEILEQLGRRIAEPETLKEAARFALLAEPKRLDIAMRTLQDAVAIEPTDAISLRNLALVFARLQRYTNAADCLESLRKLRPVVPEYTLFQAECLTLANQPKLALALYEEACADPGVPLQGVLARATLLCNIGRPREAFESLHRIRLYNWNEPAFVSNYMMAAHAANQDGFAHEGFEQLWRLREQGKVPSDALQPKSLDELIALTTEERDRRNYLLDQLIIGQCPWLFAERLLNNVPYWGWRIRTQTISWIIELPRNRASFCIYATNSYAVLQDENGRRSLQQLSCPLTGQKVVADLSALITLHRLGLLDESFRYFGNVLIPPSYLHDVVAHSGKLRPHQLSQKNTLEQINASIDAGTLVVLNGDVAPNEWQRVDEFVDANGTAVYRIRDVAEVLLGAGRLNLRQRTDIDRVATKLPISEHRWPKLDPSRKISVCLSTLQELADVGILSAVCDTFASVGLTSDDHHSLTQQIRTFVLREETRQWHDALWRILTDDTRVDDTVHIRDSPDCQYVTSGQSDGEKPSHDRIAAVDAAKLAIQEGLPLMVDDRVCQCMAIARPFALATPVFGTDCLLREMLAAGFIDKHQAADAFMKLIDWRYRFLVIPAAVLRTILEERAPHDLRNVAKYVHDCMRDTGLFCGTEAAEPPIPIAFKFYQDWVRAIAEAIADIWVDAAVDEIRATEWTTWAVTECTPSIPANLGVLVPRLGAFTPFTLFSFVMLKLHSCRDFARANRALRCIASCLGINDEEFEHLISSIIDSHGNRARG